MVAEESTQAVAVHTNSLEATPNPLGFAMECMVVVVPLDELPVRTDFHPLGTSPPLVGAEAVQVAADATVSSPDPTRWFVEMIVFPLFPV
jgi:hypothetical protein